MKDTPPSGLVRSSDGTSRCFWGCSTPLYQHYHDTEWGLPTHEDHLLFEKICLEGFQSGLSWLTILKKREAFRTAFRNFSPEVVARFNQRSVSRLLANEKIVRHRGKIEASINNAKKALILMDEFGSLDSYFWRFVPPKAERPRRVTRKSLSQLTQTPTSERLSRDLKQRGFTFVGPVTCYAFMQAMGLVNDHIEGCSFR